MIASQLKWRGYYLYFDYFVIENESLNMRKRKIIVIVAIVFLIVICIVVGALLILRNKYGTVFFYGKYEASYKTVRRGNDVLGFIEIPEKYNDFTIPEGNYNDLIDFDFATDGRGNAITHFTYTQESAGDVYSRLKNLEKEYGDAYPNLTYKKTEKATFGTYTGYLLTLKEEDYAFYIFVFEDDNNNIQYLAVEGKDDDVYRLVFQNFSFDSKGAEILDASRFNENSDDILMIGNDDLGYLSIDYLTDLQEEKDYKPILDKEYKTALFYDDGEKGTYSVAMIRYDGLNETTSEIASDISNKVYQEIVVDGETTMTNAVGEGEVDIVDSYLGEFECKKICVKTWLINYDYYVYNEADKTFVIEVKYSPIHNNIARKMVESYYRWLFFIVFGRGEEE